LTPLFDTTHFFAICFIEILPVTLPKNGCLALKNVESKTTFKNGENRRFRFVGVAGTRTKAQKRQKAQVFG
jgi:hypothetical protein